jgi:hypothetical protein
MTNNSRYKALVCWLYNLKVILPPEHFTESIFNIDVHDMVCTHFHISTIRTTTSLDTSPPGSGDAGGIAEGYVVAQTARSDKEYVEGLEMKVVALIYVIASLIIISFISGFNPNIISKSFYVHLPRTVSLYL